MERPLRFAIIGAGMSGILSAIKLTEAGYTDFTIFEKGDRVGGTWRENTYPGLSCDVPSHLYSYSFALNPEWSRRYSPGPEILSYFERVAKEHDVLPRIRFNDEVVECAYSGDGRWRIVTAAGYEDTADVVIAATGVLHHPNIPALPGLESFAGASFHSSQWDHDVELDGKRVGVIGTGSTAIQIVSALVPRVAHLTLFQRTAQWVMNQENPAYRDDEKDAFAQDETRLRTVHDLLSQMFGTFANAIVNADSPEMKMIEDGCNANLATVRDPVLRERLRPNYRAACKRLIVSPDFYEAMQQPNAELVTSELERVEPEGVRTTDGVLRELDVLALCTGFKADAFMRPMAVTGRDGVTLAQAWDPRPNAYMSISIPDFPNFFMLNGPNGPVGNFSLIEVAELQFGYILELVDRLRRGECRELSASRDAMDAHETARTEAAQGTIWMTGCRSWYLDDRGIPAVWPWTFDRFREEMAAPKMEAFECR